MPWPGSLEPPIHITVPAPIVVRTPVLLGIYGGLLTLDYVAFKFQNKLPLGKVPLRMALMSIHTTIPLVFASSSVGANLFFIAVPWFYVTYSSVIPVEKYSFREWLDSLQCLLLDASPEKRWLLATRKIPTLKLSKEEQYEARIKGVVRIVRGIGKLIIMKYLVDPLLPDPLSSVLTLPWLHPTSLLSTLLFGCKAYFFLGVADIGTGIQQMSLGVPSIDLFNSPMIASTPREFWSRRWNLYMQRLFHLLIFSPEQRIVDHHNTKKEDDQNKKKKIDQQIGVNRKLRGLSVFVTSGLYHEVLMLSLFRETTGENLLFFTLQGLMVLLEITLREKTGYRQDLSGWKRVIGFAGTWFNFALTGRIFMAPFLRYFSST
ncbi:hypothetical protein BDA99DRAFT_610260 [Phascolomyces articulosus]|uniref:Wax synthase domain-containing protein n=1 Tax=Phascolomyces articulosus TaxID=60185 RepID=A0AAD5JL66_9FUNG|nr:hypothetical protein BDA99DRAFT_610260 [Phascolomyces articulosus]